jgi:TnpA family transposase
MPRREVLTPTERAQVFAYPHDEGELIRLGTLSRTDLTFVRHHRGDHNRLGIAVQMTYLRYPSRVLGESEAPHPPLLGIVAAQLKVAPAAWSFYATRDETRREHLQGAPFLPLFGEQLPSEPTVPVEISVIREFFDGLAI